ncbi:MAG TPA: sigma-54 dependent transcriptional regulator [Candidatus Binatia bacterium]|nr:sigma-54 dependent transcriptional regulator [Candidatus Binatia bacterium]
MHILIVDDDTQMRRSLAILLRRESYEVSEAAGGEQALDLLSREVFDLMITDLHMEPMSGLDLLQRAKELHSELEAIVITAFGTIDVAVQAMKLKAFDFVTKPFQPDEILLRVSNALEKSRLKAEVLRLQAEARSAFGIEGIVGQSEAVRQVLNILPRVAQTDSTVLITGEGGTGKELVARAIALASRRANGPFISVSCGAFPGELIESELFGYEKGAHNTAFAPRKGLFEEAHGGTFFLDEIGEAPLPLQVKLLRVLEERTVRRLGGNRSTPVDIRLVAATNQNLEELIKTKQFRADLFFRLNVVRIKMPALRERIGDIPLLAAHFIEKYNQKMDKRIAGVSPQAKALLMAYHWPGNIRELENTMQSMIALSASDILDVADLPGEIRGGASAAGMRSGRLKDTTQPTFDEIEKTRILDALMANGWNITHTARALDISRATLQNKMKKFALRAPAR